MTRIAFVNGEYLPLSGARVSVLDRGFLFADGVYEVTAVIDGLLIDNAPHLARLERSLGALGMTMPMTADELTTVQRQLVERNNLENGGVYLQVTRGVADRDFTHDGALEQTVVLFTQEHAMADAPFGATGIRVISVPDLRWNRRDIKSVALLAQVMAKQAAREAGCAEAWMVMDGHVTEGGSSNAYIVRGDAIITRPLSNEILAGITRASVVALLRETGMTLEERPFTIDEALAADEAFITAATMLVCPVIEIDGNRIGAGQPGPAARRLREIYLDHARATGV